MKRDGLDSRAGRPVRCDGHGPETLPVLLPGIPGLIEGGHQKFAAVGGHAAGALHVAVGGKGNVEILRGRGGILRHDGPGDAVLGPGDQEAARLLRVGHGGVDAVMGLLVDAVGR